MMPMSDVDMGHKIHNQLKDASHLGKHMPRLPIGRHLGEHMRRLV